MSTVWDELGLLQDVRPGVKYEKPLPPHHNRPRRRPAGLRWIAADSQRDLAARWTHSSLPPWSNQWRPWRRPRATDGGGGEKRKAAVEKGYGGVVERGFGGATRSYGEPEKGYAGAERSYAAPPGFPHF